MVMGFAASSSPFNKDSFDALNIIPSFRVRNLETDLKTGVGEFCRLADYQV